MIFLQIFLQTDVFSRLLLFVYVFFMFLLLVFMDVLWSIYFFASPSHEISVKIPRSARNYLMDLVRSVL